MVSAALHDIRDAIRALIARPALSALIIGVLGSGLACVVFMTTLLNGTLLRALPFVEPDQLLQVGAYKDSWGSDYLEPMDGADLLDVRRHLGDLAQVAGFTRSTMTLSDIETPERDHGAFVSANLFGLLGVAPMLGRDFVGDDQRDGAPAVAILSRELWQSRFGGDRDIVGRQIRINAKPATVIGVMPDNFSFPTKEVVWMATPLFEGMKPGGGMSFYAVVRRSASASKAAVATALDTWFAQAVRAAPERFRGMHAGIGSLDNLNLGGALRAPLYAMYAATLLVLVLACANAGNLMLTRMLGRRHEIAMRLALGATRKRLVAYLMMESVLLSLAAMLLAVLASGAAVGSLVAWFRANDFGPAHWQRFDTDATILLFALGAALLTALATGLPAAWSASGKDAGNALRDDARGGSGRAAARLSHILLTAEVALSCALLVSVGMLVRDIVRIDHTDIGIDGAHLLTSRIALSPSAYPADADRLRLYQRLAEKLGSEPAVAEVTIGSAVPGTYWNENRPVLPAGGAPAEGAITQTAMGAVDDRFLATYGITLQEGRFFDGRDIPGGPRVAVVDRRFVEKYSADAPALGRRFRIDPRSPDGATVTVIGVIASIMLNTQQQPPQTTLLVPLRQSASPRVASVTVRVRDDSTALAPHLNKAMREIDGDTPLDFRDYAVVFRGRTKTMHIVTLGFEVLGIVALLLVGAGLYGVMVVSVGRRTREIGVRRALGAPNRQILGDLFARSSLQLAIGLALGLGSGVLFAGLLDDSLIQTGGSSNPAVALAVVALIVLTAALATIVPAQRALRVDPIEALRHE